MTVEQARRARDAQAHHAVPRRRGITAPALRSYRVLTLLLLLRTAFGLGYVRAIPMWEAYDEPFHFAYALGITADNPQRIQPPIHYLALAAFLRLAGSVPPTFAYPERNPFFYEQTAGVRYALPRPVQDDVRAAFYTARIGSLLAALVGVPFALIAARRFWPTQPDRAWTAAALVALWPQSLFSSATVSNDSLTAALGAAILWLALSARIRRNGAAALLSLAGAGLKLNLLPLAVPTGLLMLLRLPRRLIGRTILIGAGLLIGLIAALNAIPGVLLPFLRQDGQGRPVLMALWQRLTGGHAVLIPEGLRYGLDSSLGQFGWGNVPMPEPAQAIWVGLLALAALGLILSLRHGTRPARLAVPLGFLIVMIGAGLLLVLFYLNMQLLQSRYLLPALAAFALLIVQGWSALPFGRIERLARRGAVGGLVLLGVVLPIGYLPSFYARPAPYTGDLPDAQPTALAPGLELLGATVDSALLLPGERVPVQFYWRATGPITHDYRLTVEVIAADGGGYGWLHTLPAGANHPPTNWIPGEPLRVELRVPVRIDFPAPGFAHLRVTVRDAERAYRLELREAAFYVREAGDER